MDGIKNRPLVFFGVVFLPSVALFFFADFLVCLLAAGLCALLLLIPLFLRRGIAAIRVRRLLLSGRAALLGVLCGSLLAGGFVFVSLSPWQEKVGQPVQLHGIVTEISYVSDYSFSATLVTDRTSRGFGISSLALRGEFSAPLCVGDRLTVSGTLSSFADEQRRTARLAALGQGKAAILTVTEPQALQNDGPASVSILAAFDRLRQGAAARFENRYDATLASLCQDLLLGMRDSLDPMLRRDFTRLGLSHVLAVSGLHFSIFIGLADSILRRLRLAKWLRCGLLIPCILFFIGFCGASPSVLRAGIMLLMLQLLIPLAPLLLLISYFPPLATVFNFSISRLLEWLLAAMHFFADLPFAVFAVQSRLASIAAAVLYAGGLVVAFWRKKRSLFYLGFATLCAVLFLGNGIAYACRSNTVTALYASEGGGDFVVVCSGRSGSIIDCSAGNYAVLSAAAQTLSEQGKTEIEDIVYTHLHRRCIGTLQSVGKRYLVRSVVLPQGEDEALLSSMANAARRLGIAVRFYDDAEMQTLRCGDSSLVLFPRAMLSRSAEPLCSFCVQAFGRRLLFASPLYDAAAPVYRTMLEDYAKKSDITVFLSHGPKQRGGCPYPKTGGAVYAAPSVEIAGTRKDSVLYTDCLTVKVESRAEK